MDLRRKQYYLVILALWCFSLIASPAAASMGGYSVEPAPADGDTGTPVEMVKVPVSQYTLQDIVIILALSLSPVLAFPLELVFLIKLMTYLGFRRIRHSNVLENSSRSTIYHYIRHSPGTDFTEITRETGISANSLRYHLAVLRLMNKVSVLETTRNTRYYENAGRYPAMEQVVLKYLHNRPTRMLLRLLKENPDLTRVQLEIALGISGAGVNWHMHRMSEDGILAIRKDGRNARYELTTEAIPFLDKHLPHFDVPP